MHREQVIPKALDTHDQDFSLASCEPRGRNEPVRVCSPYLRTVLLSISRASPCVTDVIAIPDDLRLAAPAIYVYYLLLWKLNRSIRSLSMVLSQSTAVQSPEASERHSPIE